MHDSLSSSIASGSDIANIRVLSADFYEEGFSNSQPVVEEEEERSVKTSTIVLAIVIPIVIAILISTYCVITQLF